MTTCSQCGSPLRHRSDSDHSMFWAIIDRAYQNWPHDHEFEPLGRMHLYGWLLIEAGHHKPPIEIESRNKEFVASIVRAMFPAIKDKVHCIRFFPTAKGVRVLLPESLSYKAAGKHKYEDVRAKVYEIIEATLGVTVETLKKEADREAA